MKSDWAKRLAAVEAHQIQKNRRFFVVLPWDLEPDATEDDMVCYYRIVAPNGEYGGVPVEYERTGVHPSQDHPGSRNRELYYGEHPAACEPSTEGAA
ncbi:hypothetical protein [Sphingomonas faeni]|uniref:hypothetical protein n=1 Tax=Sphingomonas faeni TaxID=185950 RepID=UPI0020C12157|nr:hypothetical protein [Sphingomonas faeni]MCK8457030.1 hypothetical protein [Sphingomonas faeni]